MGGGDLNSKKSWHPNTMKNQERVWKAEQAAAQEQKRILELQNEHDRERDRAELNDLAKRSAGGNASNENRLHWMYDKPDKQVQQEDFLLGKAIDKNYDRPEKGDDIIPAVARRVVGSSMTTSSGDVQVDLARKIREDPLLLVKERERAARAALLNNPLHRKRLTELLRREQEQKEGSKKKKKQDLDSKLAAKLSALSGKGLGGINVTDLLNSDDSSSDANSSDEHVRKHRRKKKKDKEKTKRSKKSKKRKFSPLSESGKEREQRIKNKDKHKKDAKNRGKSSPDRGKKYKREEEREMDKEKNNEKKRGLTYRDSRGNYDRDRSSHKKVIDWQPRDNDGKPYAKKPKTEYSDDSDSSDYNSRKNKADVSDLSDDSDVDRVEEKEHKKRKRHGSVKSSPEHRKEKSKYTKRKIVEKEQQDTSGDSDTDSEYEKKEKYNRKTKEISDSEGIRKKRGRKRKSESVDRTEEAKIKRDKRDLTPNSCENCGHATDYHQRQRERYGSKNALARGEEQKDQSKGSRGQLTEEEKAARLAEMMEAGAEREQSRGRRVAEQRAAAADDPRAGRAPRSRSDAHSLPDSLESRIHSNRHYIQRNRNHMNEHFARR